jgi:hypothetical protein
MTVKAALLTSAAVTVCTRGCAVARFDHARGGRPPARPVPGTTRRPQQTGGGLRVVRFREYDRLPVSPRGLTG